MALLSEEMDSDLLRLWSLINELSEQLNNNRAIAASLQQQAAQAKGQALHSGTGFVLRRFNTDLSKEVFESELERMNASLIIENQQLLHENKQINSLLKDYEQMLETVMAKFRAQAHTAQKHELTLTRHYESLLQARENDSLNQDLGLSPSTFESLTKVSELLRKALRSLNGEDPETDVSREADRVDGPQDPDHLNLFHEGGPGHHREGGYTGSPQPLDDWALEREIEIVKLEKENEELRKLLDISQGNTPEYAEEAMREWEKTTLSKLSGPTRRGLLSNNRARGTMGRGGFSSHTAWPSPDALHRKGPNFFKEFPTT